MERARAGRTAGLARDVLERARRRRRAAERDPRPASDPEEDSERLNAAFVSIVNLMNQASKECEWVRFKYLYCGARKGLLWTWNTAHKTTMLLSTAPACALQNQSSVTRHLCKASSLHIRKTHKLPSSTRTFLEEPDQKYYSSMATCTCKEHEIKHICRYHARQAEKRELESSEEKGAEASVPPSHAQTCQQCAREGSEDIYIEVSPGFYSVTATSEDMVQQTHMVDVHAGQSIDLTFVL